MNNLDRKKILIGLVVLVFGILFVELYLFYSQNLRGALPAFLPSKENITDLLPHDVPNESVTSSSTPLAPPFTPGENVHTVLGTPLSLPQGFGISIFASSLPGARVAIFDSADNLWISQTGTGKISKLTIQNGRVAKTEAVFLGLKGPHGLAFDPSDSAMLFIAEENKISRVNLGTKKFEPIAELPTGGHSTRTIAFGPDGRLYVSIGSSCNVCRESDPRRAAIYSMNKDGSDFKPFATGLRNSVFFVWSPFDGRMWATDNGRDLIGDDIPPDEVNVIEADKNYGWPICYGKNIHDTDFDHNTYVRNPCMEPFEVSSHIDIQAHSAALGLAFVPGGGKWTPYKNNLLVALHGSWNRSVPTGYKIIRMKLDAAGNYVGTEDFVTGWFAKKGSSYEVLGRPVDMLFAPWGDLLVTDDKAGVIYRIGSL